MIAHIEQKFKWTQRQKFPLSSEECEVRAPKKIIKSMSHPCSTAQKNA